jgi:hypothetical protein
LSNTGKKWIKVKDTEGFVLLSSLVLPPFHEDPNFLPSFAKLRKNSTVTLNGEKVTKYSAQVKPLKSSPKPSGSTDGVDQLIGTATLDRFSVWLNQKNLPTRIEGVVTGNGGELTGGGGKSTVTTTTDISRFGKPVNPTSPRNVVREFADLKAALEYLEKSKP